MKEKVVISYAKGITHSPSDLLCSDGELEECVNLEVKEDELVPMEMPMKLGFSLEDGERLVHIHNIKTGPKNYFTLNSLGTLSAFHVVGGEKRTYNFGLNCGEISSIQSIGNTVVVYTSTTPYYILYKGNEYKYLGSSIPEIDLSFNLSGSFELGEEFEISTPNASKETEEFQETVVPALVAKANLFISEKSIENNKFMFPFFVRYAIRLFDGTCIHHSSPVLMCPSTKSNPHCVCIRGVRDTDMKDRTYKCQIGGMVSSLEYNVLGSDADISNWSDIISGIDVCVSRQIYTYDQNGTRFGEPSISEFVGKYNNKYSIWVLNSILKKESTLQPGDQEYLSDLYLPSRRLDDIYDEIASTSLFYKFSFIGTNDLYTGNSNELAGVLSALEVGETLSDDYMTHDILIPKSSFVYNGRLNVSNITRKLFNGYRVDSMVPMIKDNPSDGFDYLYLEYGSFYAYVYIRNANGGEDIIVRSPLSSYGGLYAPFFFYPDTDAYKMVIVNSSGSRSAYITLSEHSGLNGAYAFNGFSPTFFIGSYENFYTTENVEVMPNKLFTSNVNNPFHFPLEGIYTVGSGEILGMTAVTRPISQGQFGEFPMMMFCSDGNYAMRVDEQGFYSAISPIQEDIVLGSDKITPMENSIMIITKKGMMLTSGGEMTKVAPQMDGGVLNTSNLEGVDTTNSVFSNIIEKTSDKLGFLSYLYGSRMAFDYASNRILVYNPDKSYAYIYKFDNGTVTKLIINNGAKIVTSVIDYPDTIIQDETGALYSLYTKEDVSSNETQQNGFMLTRPLKMGGAMSMKAVKQLMSIATHGKDSYVKYLLFGSNDNNTYYKVSSRFGKPYKYYRVAIYTNLLPKESLSGTVMTIEERRIHKLR